METVTIGKDTKKRNETKIMLNRRAYIPTLGSIEEMLKS